MSKCKYEPCTKEVIGKSAYCCASCRAQHSRRNKGATLEAQHSGATVEGVCLGQAYALAMPEGATVDQPAISPDVNLGKHEDAPQATKSTPAIAEQPTGIDHYYANPDMYITRREPERLNWGAHMSLAELGKAGLKANRVSIPGDHDYTGKVGVPRGSATSHDQEARVT